jgi:hypothetical protein
MPVFYFTIVLARETVATENLSRRLERVCPDATLGSRDGVVWIAFDREGSTFPDVLASAVRDVELAGFKVAGMSVP